MNRIKLFLADIRQLVGHECDALPLLTPTAEPQRNAPSRNRIVSTALRPVCCCTMCWA